MPTEQLVPIFCGAISSALVLALIFNRPFRKDVLGGDSEAKILGIVTAKGAVVVVLCSLFLAGMVYPIATANAKCSHALGSLKAGLEAKGRYNMDANSRPTVEKLQEDIDALLSNLDEASKSCH